MMFKRFLVASLFTVSLLAIPASAGAVDVIGKNCTGRAANSSICVDNNPAADAENPIFGPKGIITTIINLLSVITGIVAVIIIILAGLKYISSGSNPQDVTQARERILYAFVGLIIAALAQVLVRFIIGKVGFI